MVLAPQHYKECEKGFHVKMTDMPGKHECVKEFFTHMPGPNQGSRLCQ